MKLIGLIISCFLFVCICSAAPFTKNSFIAACRDYPAPNYFMQEYDIEGRKLQRINFPAGYQCQNCKINLDSSGMLLVTQMSNSSTAFWAHTMNSQGEYVDVTRYSSSPGFSFATVDGQGIYAVQGTAITYRTRGSTSQINANIIANTANLISIGSLQIVGTRMYLYVSTSIASFPATMSPVPTTGTGTYIKVGPNPGISGSSFFVHPKAFYTMENGNFYKYSFNAQGQIGSSTPDYSIAVNRGAFVVHSRFVVYDVGTTTYLVFRMYNSTNFSNGYIARLTDTGSSFVNQTNLDYSDGSIYCLWLSKSPGITCSDSFKNQDETDIDCGGSTCTACSNGKTCVGNDDCSSGFCNAMNVCATPTCNDNAKNQDETDVDCGGPTCSSRCINDKSCVVDNDCLSGFCNEALICATPAPACNNNVQNQNETDIDCGGPYCPECANDKMCIAWSDCSSGYCNSSNICEQPTCADQVKNQNEADVDCGGLCEKCVTGKSCLMNEDCLSQKCESLLCVVSCLDGIMNQDETDVDCGGNTCSKCANTKNCLNSNDCTSNYCNPNNTCATESCEDNLKNQDETDTDCGGNTCTSRCSVGQSCVTNSDCDSNTCSDNSCVTAPVAPPVVPIAPPVTPPVAAPLVNIFVSSADFTVVSIITVFVVSVVTCAL